MIKSERILQIHLWICTIFKLFCDSQLYCLEETDVSWNNIKYTSPCSRIELTTFAVIGTNWLIPSDQLYYWYLQTIYQHLHNKVVITCVCVWKFTTSKRAQNGRSRIFCWTLARTRQISIGAVESPDAFGRWIWLSV